MDVPRRGAASGRKVSTKCHVTSGRRRAQPSAAVSWSGLAFGARVGTQVLSLILLSRILAPADFGIMAMAAVVIGLATVVRDLGAGPAIVREANLTASFVASQLVVAVTFGVVLAVLIVLIAPFASAVFGEPDLTPILSVLALGFVVGGLGVVPQALLERSLAFRPIAAAEILAGFVALVVALGAAVAGLGRWRWRSRPSSRRRSRSSFWHWRQDGARRPRPALPTSVRASALARRSPGSQRSTTSSATLTTR